jgi:hypothetical protein
MFVGCMVSALNHRSRLVLRNYLIDFKTTGIYYLMVATFAGTSRFSFSPSSFCN